MQRETLPFGDDDEDVDEIELGDGDDGPDLGPDERDADLMDGSWERRYYTQPTARRDWQSVYVGIALIIVMAMLVPLIMAAFP